MCFDNIVYVIDVVKILHCLLLLILFRIFTSWVGYKPSVLKKA